MTEEEWLTTTDPSKLLGRMRSDTAGRRLRLLCAAAVNLVDNLLTSRVCHLAADMAHRMADEYVPEIALDDLRRSVWEYIRANAGQRSQSSVNADSAAAKSLHPLPDEAARMSIWDATKALARHHESDWRNWHDAIQWAKARVLPLIRDIFGNPFRPVAFSPAWRTSTAVAIARQMYDSRDFGAMPILADALQDAGCECADILDHCRDPDGVHVRGCWVVDLVLGKS